MASYVEILSGRLNYYITRWRQEVREFGDQTCWWQDAVEEASIQQSGPSFSGWAALRSREETLMAIRVGINMLQFCSVSNSLSNTNLSNKVSGIFFKEVFARLLLCVVRILHEYAYEYTTCVAVSKSHITSSFSVSCALMTARKTVCRLNNKTTISVNKYIGYIIVTNMFQ